MVIRSLGPIVRELLFMFILFHVVVHTCIGISLVRGTGTSNSRLV